MKLSLQVRQFKREVIERTIREFHGNVKAAADALEVSHSTLYYALRTKKDQRVISTPSQLPD